jgi:hypothetical protein
VPSRPGHEYEPLAPRHAAAPPLPLLHSVVPLLLPLVPLPLPPYWQQLPPVLLPVLRP